MENKEEIVDKLLNQMEAVNDAAQFLDGLVILEKLIANIIMNPFEKKYRSIKITNNTIKTKIMNLKLINQLLLQLGYTAQNGELYTLLDTHITDFLQAAPAIDYKRRLLAAKSISNEAYKKELLIIQTHKQQRQEKASQQKQALRLKQQCDNDRKERKHMKVDESKSNDLKFGANKNTWKDIGVDLTPKKG